MSAARRITLAAAFFGAIALSFAAGYFQNTRRLDRRFLPPSMSEVPVRNAEGVVQRVSLLHRDRPLIVFVMSSVCRYCTQDYPNWAMLVAEAKRSNADYRVISINDAETSYAALNGTGLEDEALLFAGKEILDAAGTTAVPTVFVAGAEAGNLLVWEGRLSRTATRQIEAALRWR